MSQLALQIQSPAPPTLDNFTCGRNAEALAALRAIPPGGDGETFVFLWGPAGSGKTHLLQGLFARLQHSGCPVRWVDGAATTTPADLAGNHLLVDNVDRLAPALAEQVFHGWNRIREQGGLLVCTGLQAPAGLPLAPELATRLAWGQVFRLHGLNDDEKRTALGDRARSLAMPISDEALDYLLERASRDLPSLLATLDALDAHSLATRRAVTIPLIRELLHLLDHPFSLEP